MFLLEMRELPKNPTPQPSPTPAWSALPTLATPAQVARALQVSSRTVTGWCASGKLPVAFRCGKVLRLHPPAVAAALGFDLPEFCGTPMHARAAESTPIASSDGNPYYHTRNPAKSRH